MKPVAGLTAAILIEVARISYGRDPVFETNAVGQASRKERIAWAINRAKRLQEAVEKDDINWDWEREESIEREKRLKKGVLSKPPHRSRL